MKNKSFIFYTIVLILFSLILLYYLFSIPALLILFAIPNGFLYSILTLIVIFALPILCEIFAIYIWLKISEQLDSSKPEITPNFKKNIICMHILTVILSLVLVFYGIGVLCSVADIIKYDANSKQYRQQVELERIEHNTEAAQNCIKVGNLCVAGISFDSGNNTFKDS